MMACAKGLARFLATDQGRELAQRPLISTEDSGVPTKEVLMHTTPCGSLLPPGDPGLLSRRLLGGGWWLLRGRWLMGKWMDTASYAPTKHQAARGSWALSLLPSKVKDKNIKSSSFCA